MHTPAGNLLIYRVLQSALPGAAVQVPKEKEMARRQRAAAAAAAAQLAKVSQAKRKQRQQQQQRQAERQMKQEEEEEAAANTSCPLLSFASPAAKVAARLGMVTSNEKCRCNGKCSQAAAATSSSDCSAATPANCLAMISFRFHARLIMFCFSFSLKNQARNFSNLHFRVETDCTDSLWSWAGGVGAGISMRS